MPNELEQQSRRAEDGELPYRRFFGGMPEGVLILSASGIILSANARIAETTEMPTAELVPRDPRLGT